MAVASLGNRVLFAGGSLHAEAHSADLSARVDIFDAASGTWTTDTLSQARTEAVASIVGHVAVFAGGLTDSGYSDVIDLFDANTGQ
jgi:hypothetical protein